MNSALTEILILLRPNWTLTPAKLPTAERKGEMANKTLEKLEIKDVFDNKFYGQTVECSKCTKKNKVYDLRTVESQTKERNIYRLHCPHCNKLLIDLSLSAWK